MQPQEENMHASSPPRRQSAEVRNHRECDGVTDVVLAAMASAQRAAARTHGRLCPLRAPLARERIETMIADA